MKTQVLATAAIALSTVLLAACSKTDAPPTSNQTNTTAGSASAMTTAHANAKSVYDLKVTRLDGTPADLSEYKGKVALVVNVASECGYTPQYAGLESLYKSYKDKGLVVLGFPSNDFGGQEPGSSKDIQSFCTSKFGVTFPMFDKVKTKGDGRAELYSILTDAAGEPKWNFHKYLVDKHGKVIAGYKSAVGAGLGAEKSWRLKRDAAYALILVCVTYVIAQVVERTKLPPVVSIGVLALGPVVVAFFWRERPLRFAIAIAGILLVGSVSGSLNGSTIHKERDFFGVLKVRHDPEHKYLLLQSGSTLHGAQSVDPALKRVPLTYYHSTGPCGDVLGQTYWEGARRVGVIGLGVGSLAAYAKPGDAWTFFELNPVDVRLAKQYFTYLSDVPEGVTMDIEEGDARLRVRDGAEGRFDVLVLDAFSSDAIPLHLVTREAVAIYKHALAPGGVLLAHISNRHVRLEPVLAKLADDAGMLAIGRKDNDLEPEEEDAMKSRSHWVVLTTSSKALVDIGARNKSWKPLTASPSQTVWTDDFANVLGAMRF